MDDNASMSSHQDIIETYKRIPEAGSPANTEGRAFLEAAKRLAAAIRHGNEDDKEPREARKRALRLNWRLWTIFQAEMALDRAEMDRQIQINMLSLCRFVDKHTVGALMKPTAEALRVLIDINRNLASSLSNMPEHAAAEPGKA